MEIAMKFLKLSAAAFVTSVAISAVCAPTHAAITLGTWGNWQGAAPGNANCLNYSPVAATNPGDTHSVNWGDSAFVSGTCDPQSGYDFTGIASTNYVPSGLLDIGDFVHRNQPVEGPSITNVDLNLQIRLDDGLGPQTVGAVINFIHDETPNDANPCPYTPNNANGCSDKVSFAVAFSAPVVLNGTSYALQVLGFSIDGGSTFINDFITLEGADNRADIYARLVVSGGDCPPDCGTVPVPAPLGLIALGGSLIALHRKYTTKVQSQ
jgi:hypothetical protein